LHCQRSDVEWLFGGLAVGIEALIFCRMLVGVRGASFVALAAPFIGGAAQIAHVHVCVYVFVDMAFTASGFLCESSLGGLAVGFTWLICCSMLVRVGEASFVALAAP
jgi:hypothetical protein